MSVLGSLFNGISNSADDKGCDWYCDICLEHLNYQHGFTTSSNQWICTSCGFLNDVSEDNIRYVDEFGDDDDDNSESLSASDAALIWGSNGQDEDYLVGYTEDDLLEHI